MRVEPSIGFIGVGRMGIAVCGRLVAAGYEVVAHDRRPAREEQVRAVGATWAAEPSAAAGADVLVTMLPGTPELHEVMDEVMPMLRPGTIWIDMTSSTPETARRLGARARAAEVGCLDAPVGGDPEAARQGRLQVFVGGSSSATAACSKSSVRSSTWAGTGAVMPASCS
jgi:3-hydroxyisobutyrate dehydrogenase